MNIFQTDYSNRMREWKSLRIEIRGCHLKQACVMVDDWWQKAPLINHHLHWADMEAWPDPWTLLSENTYCTLTRALGMCYTLLLSDITDVNIIMASDIQGEDHNLVIVGNAHYVLNYHPKSVTDINITDFRSIRTLNLDLIKQKIA